MKKLPTKSQLHILTVFMFLVAFNHALPLPLISLPPLSQPQESLPPESLPPVLPPEPHPPTPSQQPSWPPSISPPVTPIEYIDPTLPPLLPTRNPKCTLHLLHYDLPEVLFRAPFVSAAYSPPSGCPAPWSRIVLELSGTTSNLQKDRTAAIWIDGAEILRTTTPLPMTPFVFWRVEKDVTRYAALFRTGRRLSMMLTHDDSTLAGVYTANVSVHFYRGPIRNDNTIETNIENSRFNAALPVHPSIKGIYQEPADMIIPISTGNISNGFWFRVENETEVQMKSVVVPNNTYRAVLEVYASHHGGDEYWYINPVCSGDIKLTLDGLESAKPNGAFRQVVASVDGRYVGSAIPFPVIYPSSINPYFWAPVAAIGAYDHPSYDLEITSFIGLLIDGKSHDFGLAVRESQPYWLISANLHLWLDEWSDEVEAGLIRYKVPPFHLTRQADWDSEEGKSEMEGQIIYRFAGWVSSSKGNITTFVRHRVKFKSQVEVEEKGESKNAELEVKERTNIRIEADDSVLQRVVVDRETPVLMSTMTSNGGGETVLHKTKLFHGLHETRRIIRPKMDVYSTVADRQESEGSVLVQDGMAMWGSGDTKSMYKFRDGKECYLRTLNIVGGKVKEDEASASCSAASETVMVTEV